MEFFRKLGYGHQDVLRVLDKLGEGALENDVLQELIQTGSRPGTPEASDVPRLVPRGCGAPASAPLGLRADLEEENGSPAGYLRPIVIDGSNVAMSHGNKEIFSCRGIQLAVDWFRTRGHTYIKVFVPSWRREPPRSDTPIREQHVLAELERQAVLVYTPSRKVQGKRVVCYDDRYIVKVAFEQDGVIVSNDNYRDLQRENPEWKRFIEQRLLMFSFVNDRFMPPDDPLGRRGPTLSNFLSRKLKPPEPSWQHCPYGKRCTYGAKCRFSHPERPQGARLTVADELRAQRGTLGVAGVAVAPPRGAQVTSLSRDAPARDWGARYPQQADVASLGRSFAGLACSEDLDSDSGVLRAPPPATSFGPDSRGRDQGTSSWSPALSRLSCTPGPRDPGLDALPWRRTPPATWALESWGDNVIGGSTGSLPSASLEGVVRSGACPALCSPFQTQRGDRFLALSPALRDLDKIVPRTGQAPDDS